MKLTDVPWDRIVHFYGRATDVPSWIRDLATPEHQRAESLLLHNLEHQDGVIQATPLAVAFMLEALREGRVQDRDAVNAVLARILDAARFQIEVHGRPPAAPALTGIMAPSSWWPEFESDETDEALWEEWSPSEEELSGWAALTEEMITAEGIDAIVDRRVDQPARVEAGTECSIRKPWWRFW